jgi:hypothetical protein
VLEILMTHDPTQAGSAPTGPAAESRTAGDGMPRWVKVVLAVVIVLLLLLVVLFLVAPGEHGPGRHLSQSSIPASLQRDGLVLSHA